MRLFFLFLFILIGISSYSQQTIKGRLYNSVDQKPISYANIGIVNSPVGGLSNEDGSFQISIPEKYYHDTLRFSALGFETGMVAVQSVTKSSAINIGLNEKITVLKEITVTAKKKKEKAYALGNRFTKGGFLYGDSVSAGAAMALLIENKYPAFYAELTYPFLVEEVNVFIHKNTLQNFKLRLRFLEQNATTGQPDKDMLPRDVIVTSSINKGWLSVDVRPYHIVADKPFYLVVEWIMQDQERLALLDQYANFRKANPDKVTADSTVVNGKKIGFWSYHGFSPGTHLGVSPIPFSLQNYTCYYRTNSFGEWKRAPVILTARVSVVSLRNATPTKNRDQLAEAVEKADKLITDFMSQHNIHGAQIAVIKQGKLVMSRAYGFADVKNGLQVTSDTRFRIGSISKAISSAGLLQLQRDKALDLDQPVGRYLPTLASQYRNITTRQLAGHLGGIRHYRENDAGDLIRKDHFTSAIDALKIIANDSLMFEPGTNYHYSSFGWNIIGATIESVSGQHYLDFMRDHVWKPFGLQHTAGATPANLVDRCSKGYLDNGQEFGEEDYSYKYASGGLVSTAEDLVSFGNQMLQNRQDTFTQHLFQSMHLPDGTATNYGIGWNLGQDHNAHPIYFHSGNLINGGGFLVLYPEDNMAVAFLGNGPASVTLDIRRLGALFNYW